MMVFCDVSIALISGVPPLQDWASMLAPALSNSFTSLSWGGQRVCVCVCV